MKKDNYQMGGRIRYAYLDEEPVAFDDDQAYRFSKESWVRMHLADAMCKAKLLTRADFLRYFGGGNGGRLPISEGR